MKQINKSKICVSDPKRNLCTERPSKQNSDKKPNFLQNKVAI